MNGRERRLEDLYRALETKSQKVALNVADAHEAKDASRVEAALAAREAMMSFLRGGEVDFVAQANEGTSNENHSVRGSHYIVARLDPVGFLAATHSSQARALEIPEHKVFVVPKPSDEILASWMVSIEKGFGGGVRTAEEMLIRNRVVAVNPFNSNVKRSFVDQLVRINEQYFTYLR